MLFHRVTSLVGLDAVFKVLRRLQPPPQTTDCLEVSQFALFMCEAALRLGVVSDLSDQDFAFHAIQSILLTRLEASLSESGLVELNIPLTWHWMLEILFNSPENEVSSLRAVHEFVSDLQAQCVFFATSARKTLSEFLEILLDTFFNQVTEFEMSHFLQMGRILGMSKETLQGWHNHLQPALFSTYFALVYSCPSSSSSIRANVEDYFKRAPSFRSISLKLQMFSRALPKARDDLLKSMNRHPSLFSALSNAEYPITRCEIALVAHLLCRKPDEEASWDVANLLEQTVDPNLVRIIKGDYIPAPRAPLPPPLKKMLHMK